MIALSYMVNSGWAFSSSYTFQLSADLDFSQAVLKESNTSETSSVTNFEPIGLYATWQPFSANFDGNSKTISNLKITNSNINTTRQVYGLFGFCYTSKETNDKMPAIKNLILEKPEITFTTTSVTTLYIGSLVGYDIWSKLQNCTVQKSNINVNVNLTNRQVCVGGIMGYYSATSKDGITDLILTCVSSENTIRNENGYTGGFFGSAVFTDASNLTMAVSTDNDATFSYRNTSNQIAGTIKNCTIQSATVWADAVGIAHTYSQSSGVNMIPTTIFSAKTNSNADNTVITGSFFNSDKTYLYTNQWNFVARLGETFNTLNSNAVTLENTTTTTTFVCDMAAFDFVYQNDGANNWNTTGLYATDNMTAGAGYFVWPFNYNTNGDALAKDEANDLNYITQVTPSLLSATPTDGNPYTVTNNGTSETGTESGTQGYWYALGNPFNKALAKSDIINTANASSTTKSCVYINNNGSTEQIGGSGTIYVYDSYSQGWDTEIDSILPGQGFMVYSTEPNKELKFNMQYPSTTTQTSAPQNFGITFSCLANGMSAKMYAKQVSEAEDGFDVNDAFALFGNNENLVEPYFVVEG
ncbi:MAG: hypothetical protein Q4Q06_08000, partial [Bacteroidota bacterium]|nr:hypothetical protein [Bacteroidota bacterium]